MYSLEKLKRIAKEKRIRVTKNVRGKRVPLTQNELKEKIGIVRGKRVPLTKNELKEKIGYENHSNALSKGIKNTYKLIKQCRLILKKFDQEYTKGKHQPHHKLSKRTTPHPSPPGPPPPPPSPPGPPPPPPPPPPPKLSKRTTPPKLSKRTTPPKVNKKIGYLEELQRVIARRKVNN